VIISYTRGDRLSLTKAGAEAVQGTVRWCEDERMAVDMDGTLECLYLATQGWIDSFNAQYGKSSAVSSFELISDYQIEVSKSEWK
jgi:hypothetical protein